LNDEVLVKVEGVSKKFCKSLKRSLWYGAQDVSAEMLGRKGQHDDLRRNEFWAVSDVSFELKRGECLGLIGPNGAGKSTLLKMLNGLVKPDKGRITMRGRVGALIELGAGFNPILTARENIYVNGSVLGFSKKEIDRKFDAIVNFAEIEEFVDTPVQSFSSGMNVRLGFAVAIQMEPDALLIDEVLAVGDAGFKAKCFKEIARITRNTAVIFVSHTMPDITRTCSSVSLLDQGQLIAFGSDISNGISHYLKRFRNLGGEYFETQTARLIELKIDRPSFHENYTSIPVLKHMEALTIKIVFNLSPETGDCLFNLNFHNESDLQIAQCASIKSKFIVRGNEENQTVMVFIPNLPFSLGRYSISIYCVEKLESNRRGAVRFFRHNAATFLVEDETPGYVSIHLPADWKSLN
jgi:lipopolysaccharide transport system ATP-binding protein